jgi:diguanylate cyclase
LARLFAIYAAISLVPILILGVVLATSYRSDARERGIAEGRSEAALVARTAVEPLLSGRPLSAGLTPVEQSSLERLAARASHDGSLLRIRLRDLNGIVVFSGDGSGFGNEFDDEAVDAAGGEEITVLTHLNSDLDDSGPAGIAVIEIYRQLSAGSPARPVGVLEMYLPYAPIERDVSAALHRLYRDLATGLALLWLLLFAICASVTRGLRGQVALSTFLAEHDPLTKLPNRRVFHQRAKEALAKATRDKAPLAIAVIDLDRFKDINSTLGHQSGDLVIVELARRLKGAVADGDTVARLGGDEFGLILQGVADAAAVSSRITGVFDHDVEVGGLGLAIEASVGFVVAPEDGSDVEELLQRADVAMYVAKTKQIDVVRYCADDDHYDAHNLELVGELRRGIDAGELVLHYQPKARLTDGRVEKIEALARWQHPVHGLLSPDRFIPLAEQTDLIDKLTTWALTTALTELRQLGPLAADMSVAVNVSARNLTRVDFAECVVQMLTDLAMPAGRLVLEITETALLTDPIRAASVLAELSEAGVRISLDDFGSGQTSLGYLSALPIHELKIDGSFVTDMVVNAAHNAIVRSIIDLGHNLGLRVVGEGVETNGVLLQLRQAGCDVAQGFLLARPMPIAQLAHWLGALPPGGAAPAWTNATSWRSSESFPPDGHRVAQLCAGIKPRRSPDVERVR